jgi:hypothetical protein
MKKKLSIVIMAHPDRAEFIPYLQERLGGDIPVVFDERNNIWDTCRRAWLAIDRDAKYGLVLQDDALVCDGFLKKAGRVLKEDAVYSFYAGELLRTRITKAVRQGATEVRTNHIYHEIALAMRTKRIEEMVRFCDDREAQDDHEIDRYARRESLEVIYSVPSLIDHRDTESLYRREYNVGMQHKARKAVLYDGK